MRDLSAGGGGLIVVVAVTAGKELTYECLLGICCLVFIIGGCLVSWVALVQAMCRIVCRR